jgi:cyanophycin synthetase
MIAAVLREQGVREEQITIIPDEQEAIAHALGMARPSDLLLVFADALTRSWKQVIKFKPDASAAAPPGPAVAAAPAAEPGHRTLAQPGEASVAGKPGRDADELAAAGFVRDERGLRFVGEAGD